MYTKNKYLIIFLLFVSFLFSNNISGIYNTKKSKYAHYTLKIHEIYSNGFKFHILGTNPTNLHTCDYEGIAYFKSNILNSEKIAISQFEYDTFDYQTAQTIEKKCEDDSHSYRNKYALACIDGPVFNIEELSNAF